MEKLKVILIMDKDSLTLRSNWIFCILFLTYNLDLKYGGSSQSIKCFKIKEKKCSNENLKIQCDNMIDKSEKLHLYKNLTNIH